MTLLNEQEANKKPEYRCSNNIIIEYLKSTIILCWIWCQVAKKIKKLNLLQKSDPQPQKTLGLKTINILD